jgi:hypothetical protein
MDKLLLIDTLISQADELDAQAVILYGEIAGGTREEWEAYELITRASAYLRSAAQRLDFN